jgi:hypothetical protein
MALYIPIRKQSEDQQSVIYLYGVEVIKAPIGARSGSRVRNAPLEYHFGQFKISRQSGGVEIIEIAEEDNDQRHFTRAARKVYLHWKEGELPDETCWVS